MLVIESQRYKTKRVFIRINILSKSCIPLNIYSLIKNMTKKLRVMLVSFVIVIVLMIAYAMWTNNSKENNSDKSLWNLVNEMNWLRDIKQECLDNLNYLDTIKQAKWYTWYCDSRDEEIKWLRTEINKLQHKDYEDLMGLM